MKNKNDINQLNDYTKLKVQPGKAAKVRGFIVFCFFYSISFFNLQKAMMRSMRYYQNKIQKKHNKWKKKHFKDIYEGEGRETPDDFIK